MNTSFDPARTVLFGTDLRILLNSDHISYGEVHTTLKAKGIYIGNSEKAVTVPLLASTLLTPDGFSRLLEQSVTRESQEKIKLSEIELTDAAADWIAPLKSHSFPEDESLAEGAGNIEFTIRPHLTVASDDKISVHYQVCRKDYSKDLLQRELNFGGTITIERRGKALRLDFEATHSSKETEVINRRLTSHITKALKAANITKMDEAEQITFGRFSNEERVRFFSRLIAGVPTKLESGSVSDIEINLDTSVQSPSTDPKIAWMGDSVRRLRLAGKKMNEVFLITDETLYGYYHIQKMDVWFAFADGAVKGKCEISFSFSSSSRAGVVDRDAALVFMSNRFSYKGIVNADAKKRIGENVNSALKNLIQEKYQAMLDDRQRCAQEQP